MCTVQFVKAAAVALAAVGTAALQDLPTDSVLVEWVKRN